MSAYRKIFRVEKAGRVEDLTDLQHAQSYEESLKIAHSRPNKGNSLSPLLRNSTGRVLNKDTLGIEVNSINSWRDCQTIHSNPERIMLTCSKVIGWISGVRVGLLT
ncbi:hypothetical protein CDAR_412861 [Caerostris darwini]|uniref:Uncharacterized protein n=1 Tax=Caerostris darwini TaxID=1538125 RepID=A0AAV4SEL2_9ARAC|nr:hypothetical protein CDAR_412861 [Caerostris darwini]